jgi:hypothetical protein
MAHVMNGVMREKVRQGLRFRTPHGTHGYGINVFDTTQDDGKLMDAPIGAGHVLGYQPVLLKDSGLDSGIPDVNDDIHREREDEKNRRPDVSGIVYQFGLHTYCAARPLTPLTESDTRQSRRT